MKRVRLRKVYLKNELKQPKQLIIISETCVSLLKKSKRFYFENLDIQLVRENKKFWKNVVPLFSNKIRKRESHF